MSPAEIDAAMARRPSGMSGGTVLKIVLGGESVRAAAYGDEASAIPVIEYMGCREYFEPLVSWQQLQLPKAAALAYAQACIDKIRGVGEALPVPVPLPG